jgi:TPP-dependent pyruvate/acetoin dehydrogenase alpha subunit
MAYAHAASPFTIYNQPHWKLWQMANKATQAALAAATQSESRSLIRIEKLKQLYVAMLQCRLLEQRAPLRSPEQNWPVTQPKPIRREATEIGCTIDLRSRDAVTSPHGGWLSAILQRSSLRTQLGGRQRSMQHFGEQSAEQLIASAAHAKSAKSVVVAFTDNGSPSTWQPLFKHARSQSLPIIFVERDSLSGKWKGLKGSMSKFRAEDFDFPGIPVDGHDVVAVYRVAHESIQRARRGCGPTLIQCEPYLLDNDAVTVTKNGGRSGASGGTRNGSAGAGKKHLDWTVKDPIEQMERYLMQKGLFQDSWKSRVLREFSKELDAALGTTSEPGLHETLYPSV